MVKNRAIDRLRAKRRVSQLEHDLVDANGVGELERQEQWNALSDALHRLDQEEYVVLMKFYRGGVPIRELADEHGIGYSAMATRLFRIKEKLRSELGAQE